MRRFLMLGSMFSMVTALSACNNSGSTNDAGTGNDSGNPADSGSGADAGGGTLAQLSHGNALPAPWTSSTSADFDPTNDGGAASRINGLVEFTAQGTTQGPDGGNNAGCPTPFVYQTNCDGFQLNATGGAAILVDWYVYAGDPTACASKGNGATLQTVRGVWYNDFGAYAVALTDCSDIGVGTPYAGTGTPPSTPAGSMTVTAMLASSPANGASVTVSGVVVAVHNGGDTFTAAIEDPNGGPKSATAVYKSDTSPSTAAIPAIGDYVTATGTWSVQYQNVNL